MVTAEKQATVECRLITHFADELGFLHRLLGIVRLAEFSLRIVAHFAWREDSDSAGISSKRVGNPGYDIKLKLSPLGERIDVA
jgi:hypothetical protein